MKRSGLWRQMVWRLPPGKNDSRPPPYQSIGDWYRTWCERQTFVSQVIDRCIDVPALLFNDGSVLVEPTNLLLRSKLGLKTSKSKWMKIYLRLKAIRPFKKHWPTISTWKGYALATAEDGKTAVELIRSNNHLKNRRTNARLVQGVYDYNCDP